MERHAPCYEKNGKVYAMGAAAAETLLTSPNTPVRLTIPTRHFNEAPRCKAAVRITTGAKLMLKRSFFAVVYPESPIDSAFRLGLSCLLFFAVLSTASAQTINTASKPQLVPNARRYKESGLKPATGRSGSASLPGRALLGKDGATTVELSTGQRYRC